MQGKKKKKKRESSISRHLLSRLVEQVEAEEAEEEEQRTRRGAKGRGGRSTEVAQQYGPDGLDLHVGKLLAHALVAAATEAHVAERDLLVLLGWYGEREEEREREREGLVSRQSLRPKPIGTRRERERETREE